MSYFEKTLLTGNTDGGTNLLVPVTAEGHLEVAVHSPRLPFGSLHVENLIPVFQTDAVYGLCTTLSETGSLLGGSVTSNNSQFDISTGTGIYGQSYLQSRKRLKYRPGQGIVGRFTGKFTTGVDNSYQVIGLGHAGDGIYFGYSGSTFGILYNSFGNREVQKLNITTPSSTTELITIRLNGNPVSSSVTNSGNAYRTAYEISRGTYTGWKTFPLSSSVYFVADAVGMKPNAFNITASTAVGTFSRFLTGSIASESFVRQVDWNGDPMDGTGPTGVILDPTKGNVYQLGIQYLGYGAITCYIESAPEGNNSEFINVHTFKIPNSRTVPTFRQPSFPFTTAVYSAGSTTNLVTSVASFAGFIEGQKRMHGPRYSYNNTIATAGANNYQSLFTVLNERIHRGIVNQSVINILDVSIALKHNQPATFYLIRNGTLSGNPAFNDVDSNSSACMDTAATTVTFDENSQLVWVGNLSDTSNLTKEFSLIEELTLQPGESITLACKTSGGTATYAAGSINTREDQ